MKNYYQRGLGSETVVSGDIPTFYTWFLNNLRRESKYTDAKSAVDVYNRLREEYKNPTLSDQLIIISMFVNAGARVSDGIGFPHQVYETDWWEALLIRAAVLQTQIVAHRKGLPVSPDWEGNWLAVGKFALAVDHIADRWDELQGKDAVEVVRETVRDIARSSVRSPLRDEIMREVEREATPWMPEIKTLAIVGGAILGAVILLPNMMSKAGSATMAQAKNLLPDSKGKRQAEAVATKIMAKTK